MNEFETSGFNIKLHFYGLKEIVVKKGINVRL